MASIRDVAKLANVGPATVSRVINNNGYVSEDARERVNQAIDTLNYTPNELARNLFRSRAGLIGILVPDISHPFFSTFVSCAERELYQRGYKVMLCNTSEEGNAEQEYLSMLERHIVDGIITDVHTLNVEEYKRIQKPIVALDRYLGKNIPVVSSDHREGGRLAALTLIRNGCRKVLHFKAAERFEAPFLERHTEFNRVMAEYRIQVVPFEIEWNEFRQDYFRDAIAGLFEKGFDYDRVFGGDLPAVECMNQCLRHRIRVPDDVKIVAYDGTFVTEIASPHVTSVVQPVQQLAKTSVEIMMQELNGIPSTEKHIRIPVTLRKGDTTIM